MSSDCRPTVRSASSSGETRQADRSSFPSPARQRTRSMSSSESNPTHQRREYYLKFWGGEPRLDHPRGRTRIRTCIVDYSDDREYNRLNHNNITTPPPPTPPTPLTPPPPPMTLPGRHTCVNPNFEYPGSLIFPLSMLPDMDLPQWTEKTGVTLPTLQRCHRSPTGSTPINLPL